MNRRVWIAVAAAVLIAVAVVAFVSYRGAGSGGTLAQRVKVWVTGTGLGQDLGALRADGADIDKVLAEKGGTAAIHTVCDVLSVTAESANSNLPTPDTALTQLLARAYSLEYEAGNNCYAAGSTNARLLAESATERAQAEKVMDRALARVGALTGKSVPTTTTTVPTTGTTGILG